ncbi:MAG: DUF2232 domain-containing protein [Eubacteriales bacterium]|nr:DUF2232 domain-containing protein [Eubacteriales bacterium]
MKLKQTIMLIIGLVLCLAIYPLYNLFIGIMLLITATTASLAVISDTKKSLLPTLISIALALAFYFAFDLTYATPGILAFVASITGFVMGKAIKSKWSLPGVLLFSGVTALACIIGAIIGINRLYDMDFINVFMSACKDASISAVSIFANTLPPDVSVAQVKEQILFLYDYMLTLVPSFFIMICGIYAYVSFGIARYILKKQKILLPMLPDRRHLIMSRASGWVMILVWLLSYLMESSMIKYALINISIIISGLFFICGVSLALNLIEYRAKVGITKRILRLLLFVTLIFAYPLTSEIFVMAAIMDSVWNFRRIDRTAK